MKLARVYSLSLLLVAAMACGKPTAPEAAIGSRPLPSAELGGPNASTTSIASSLNPATYGQGVTFTATIVGQIANGVPTGTVRFNAGAIFLGPAPPLAPGPAATARASFNSAALAA